MSVCKNMNFFNVAKLVFRTVVLDLFIHVLNKELW